jgi:hypothetical protein
MPPHDCQNAPVIEHDLHAAMLTYDSPISVNGQAPASPASLSTQTATSKSLSTIPAIENGSLHGHDEKPRKFHHIWLVTGPAGCGKSTIAEHLSKSLNIPFVEGDQVIGFSLFFFLPRYHVYFQVKLGC